jgi:hypothetical protein
MKTEARWATARRLLVGAAIVGAMQAVCLPPAVAGEAAGAKLTSAATEPAAAPVPDWKDDAIRRAFRDVLDRQPTGEELREYRSRIDRDHWTESEIRDDLRSRTRERGDRDRDQGDRDRDPGDRDRDRGDRDRNNDRREVDRAIYRAYDEILHREPDPEGLRTYRREMLENGWTETEVRRALRSSGEREVVRREMVDRAIQRAYRDILHRDPDPEGLRTYRREMLQNGWTEQEVRRALRTSGERDGLREQDAERVVRRIYQEVLGREPDQRGLSLYRDRMVRERWSEDKVRDALMDSPEYRDKNRMTRDKAVEIVRRAYREVLRRDPDPAGLESYVGRIMRERWTEQDVVKALRSSDEYRKRR